MSVYQADLAAFALLNTRAALRFYKLAATPVSGQMQVYSPPVGKETYGRIISVRSGEARPAMATARAAIERLQQQ